MTGDIDMPSGIAADEGNAISLSTVPPELGVGEAAALAQRLYGVETTATLLTSERDQNFHLASPGGEAWLLKISNPAEPDDIVDFQTAALDHIGRHAPSSPVPRVLRTLDGGSGGDLVLADGRRSRVRLLSYLEGVPARGTVRTRAQTVAMGTALAELDRALADFTHPRASHDLLWNVGRAERLFGLLDEGALGERAALLRRFMDRFDTQVRPKLPGLRKQVVHNDYHLFNVLVSAADESRVTGIIDFGDMIEAPLVAEVATAAAYQLRATDDPLGSAAEFIAAYHAVLPLEDAEQAIIADLMATRHLITVLISEWRALRYPGNRAYIMRHNPESWDALFMMVNLTPAALRDRLLSGIVSGDQR